MTLRSSLSSLSSFSLIALGAATCLAQGDLQWKFPVGDKMLYRTTVESTTTRGSASPKRKRHVIDARWTVVKAENGVATVAIDVERVQYKDRRNSYDSEKANRPRGNRFATRLFKTIDSLIAKKTSVTVEGTGQVSFAKPEDQPRFYMQRDATRLGVVLPKKPSDAPAGWARHAPVLGELAATDSYRYRIAADALEAAESRIAIDYDVKRTDETEDNDKDDDDKGKGKGKGKGKEDKSEVKSYEGRGTVQFDRETGRMRWLREETIETTTTTRRGKSTDLICRTITTIALITKPARGANTIELEEFDGSCMCAFDGKSLGRMPKALKKLRDRLKAKWKPGSPIVISPAHEVRQKHVRAVITTCAECNGFPQITIRPFETE